MSIEYFKHIYFRLPVIVRLLLSIFVVMTFFGVIIHIVEPSAFPSVFDGIWWAFITGATVGYGDFVPLTPLGKVIAILLILSGGGLLTFYIMTLSAGTIQHEQDLSKGKVKFKGADHIVIVGWNERTRQLVNMIDTKDSKEEIVLIDRTLDHLPYQHYPVHFIHGDPSEDSTLIQANILEAKSVIIASDITKKERQADITTILAIVAIRGNNQHVSINAEVLSISQIENAIRAGANTIIRTNDFISTLFYHELYHLKNTRPFETVLSVLNNQQFSHLPLPEQLEDSTFKNGIIFYLDKKELLFGFIRDDDWVINPPKDTTFKKGDILLTLTSW
ncbi:potassium channel family protein [Virgibacillus sp. L01]|uniref:potassium channel family protein n=1 Tax=Virgibacillus sp. L01 TaxID=3457429 RepID=UPI003FD0EAF7